MSEQVVREGSRPVKVELQPYSYWRLLPTAFAIHRLARNNPDLIQDFPGVPARYSTLLESVKSVRRARRNKNLSAFLIKTQTELSDGYAVNGLTSLSWRDYVTKATVRLGLNSSRPVRRHRPAGVATIVHEANVTDQVAPNVAIWLDAPVRGYGVGTLAMASLAERAFKVDPVVDRVTTVARPTNFPSVTMLEANGFTEVGAEARDYEPEMGDGVHVERQAFIKTLDNTL